jgi:hypothetical protein
MSQKDIHTLDNEDCTSLRDVRLWMPFDAASNPWIRDPSFTLLLKPLNLNITCSLRLSSKPALLITTFYSKHLLLSAQFVTFHKIRTTCVFEAEMFASPPPLPSPVTCCDNSRIAPELSIPSSLTVSNLNQMSVQRSNVNYWYYMYWCVVMSLSCSHY